MSQVRGMQNPQAFLQQLLQKNPNLQAILSKGNNLQQIAQAMAQQRGIDLNQLLQRLQS